MSETFLAAWRRWDEVPDPAIPRLLVTARRVVANHRRSVRRHLALADRIALLDSVAATPADTAEAATARGDALEALARLSEQHREALLLVSWDGLTSDQATAASAPLHPRPTPASVRWLHSTCSACRRSWGSLTFGS